MKLVSPPLKLSLLLRLRAVASARRKVTGRLLLCNAFTNLCSSVTGFLVSTSKGDSMPFERSRCSMGQICHVFLMRLPPCNLGIGYRRAVQRAARGVLLEPVASTTPLGWFGSLCSLFVCWLKSVVNGK